MTAKVIRPISILNLAALVAVGVVQVVLFALPAKAGNFEQVYIRLDRLAASTTTGGMVCAQADTVGTEADVQVTFPTGFTVNTTASNWTVTTTNLPSGATAWPGIGTASAVSGQTVTFPSSDMTVSTLYCFNFSGTSTLTNATAGNDKTGTVTTRTSGPATIDSSGYALSIVSNDQIVVTATVPATFSFALSGNTDAFTTNLSSSSVVSTSGRTVTISTNAASGWVAWVRSANAALNSASTGASIATAGSVDNAPSNLDPTVGYVLDVDITTDSGTGTGTVTQASNYGAEYNGTTAEEGGTLSTSFQPIAASNGTTGGDVLTLTERAFISAVQAAATDYTDTLTVVAAGRF
ncbi:MAG: hypothetical protein E6Q06_04960 [Candidatus Moraniibacteriota bacterium]|nr:MAG: hypothetical protein E6Q06_04960 [Candidatus Moranbacteria bacterium]